ncbi:hypothetical protein BJ508DRAFT_414428 [Ascobolus immersus RN42]|uniref:Uncharacterized protein n=1 Tax=Ascobolus immersus RN42 TaxID=1160509 RepID=A0A3N4I906_ASCIM|nr:hypothetical protein BJ508DRAFT_414428 [Ascobolus immersus RN42]
MYRSSNSPYPHCPALLSAPKRAQLVPIPTARFISYDQPPTPTPATQDTRLRSRSYNHSPGHTQRPDDHANDNLSPLEESHTMWSSSVPQSPRTALSSFHCHPLEGVFGPTDQQELLSTEDNFTDPTRASCELFEVDTDGLLDIKVGKPGENGFGTLSQLHRSSASVPDSKSAEVETLVNRSITFRAL